MGLKKLNIELPCDLTIPHFGIYSRIEGKVSNRYLHTHVHTPLFTVVKMWKQSKCPLTNEQINKMWYIHTV
jgi:hypothetical protein